MSIQCPLKEKTEDQLVQAAGCRATSTDVLGASTRASLGLYRASQSLAVTAGRDFVIPDDVKALATPVLRHRVILAPELELEGVTADAALQTLIERVEAPRA